jgi:hypothetical protein
MTRKIAIAALVLLSLTGCVIVPYGSGHHYHGLGTTITIATIAEKT